MERSGMRWTPSMAEAIVKLRSLYLSGDFDDYWPFHVAQDQIISNGCGYFGTTAKCPEIQQVRINRLSFGCRLDRGYRNNPCF
jgi:hypothetical protein